MEGGPLQEARAALAVTLSLMLVGCRAFTVDPEPESPPPPRVAQLAGNWSGTLEVDGQRIPGSLLLRQNGNRLEATFTAEQLGGETSGSGRVAEDGGLSLELDYRTQCPGTIALTGAVLDGAARLAGSLAARDCTGQAAGAFSFTR